MSPSTGTFISMDTYEGSIYDPDTLHKYLYANGNPVKYSDPTGNFSAVTMAAGMAINDCVTTAYNVHLMGILYLTAAISVKAFAIVAFGMSAADTIMCFVLLVASVNEKNTKGILVYGTLMILSLISLYENYSISGEIIVSGDKGSSTIEVKGDSPRGALSDYLGVSEANSHGSFYSIKNRNGGEVYVSSDEIGALDFADIVSEANGKANVNIISGVHGDKNGNISVDLSLYLDDVRDFETANVYNYAELDAKQICDIINSSDLTICAWCYSEYNSVVRMALSMD